MSLVNRALIEIIRRKLSLPINSIPAHLLNELIKFRKQYGAILESSTVNVDAWSMEMPYGLLRHSCGRTGFGRQDWLVPMKKSLTVAHCTECAVAQPVCVVPWQSMEKIISFKLAGCWIQGTFSF